jgi:hypothetical protein
MTERHVVDRRFLETAERMERVRVRGVADLMMSLKWWDTEAEDLRDQPTQPTMTLASALLYGGRQLGRRSR